MLLEERERRDTDRHVVWFKIFHYCVTNLRQIVSNCNCPNIPSVIQCDDIQILYYSIAVSKCQ